MLHRPQQSAPIPHTFTFILRSPPVTILKGVTLLHNLKDTISRKWLPLPWSLCPEPQRPQVATSLGAQYLWFLIQ
jgi:hypothetical protein